MAKKRLQKGGQVQDDSITIRLRLTGLRVLAVKEAGKWIEVVAQYRDNEAVCPRCERSTWQGHQWHIQRKRDAKLWGKEVGVALLKRRFRCRHCRKVFTEPDPACGPRRRTTGRLRQTAARRAREAPGRAGGRGGGAGERRGGVQGMLERHAPGESVRAVAIDLSEAYRQAVELVLPDAAVVADKFHVLALAGRAPRAGRGATRRGGNLAWLLQRGAERLSRLRRERDNREATRCLKALE